MGTYIKQSDGSLKKVAGNARAVVNINDTVVSGSNAYSNRKVDELIGSVSRIKMLEVESLPAIGATDVIYLLRNESGGCTQYIYSESKGDYSPIGTTDVDLSAYFQKGNVVAEFSEGPSDSRVPSERLVKESLDGLEEKIEGMGGAAFAEGFTANVTVGGVESGTVVAEGDSVADVVRRMLLRYVKPEISLTLDPSTTLYYRGQSVASEGISVTVAANSGKVTKVVVKRGDTVLDTVEDEGGVASASFTDTEAVTDTVTYTAVGSGSDDVSASKTVTFCNPTFAGTVASTLTEVTANDVAGLAKKFANNRRGYTYTGITMDYGKVLYAYPKSFGALTSISDGTYSYTDSYTRSEVTLDIGGEDVVYYAYLLTDATGVSNFKQIYS